MRHPAPVKTRRLIVLLAAVTALAVATYFVTDGFVHRNHAVDTSRLIAALQAFSRNHETRGQQLPSAVSLRELLVGHYLTPADVRAFDGMEVTFSLSVDESRPQQIMIRARLPDGREIEQLADGAVQQLR
jgi:hypothetical protein